MHQEKKVTSASVTEKLASFIVSIRIFLLVFLGLIFGGILFYFVYTEVTGRIREESTILVEKAEKLYADWSNQEDEQEKKRAEEKLLSELDIII